MPSPEAALRRVIKPFAVEVRGGGRKTRVSEPKAPVWPEFSDQPVVEWPEALLAPTAHHSPVKTTEQLSAPPATESYRDPRKPPPARAVMPEAVVSEKQLEKPKGRVLPVIKDRKPLEIEAAEEIVTARPPTVRAQRAKTVRVAGPIAAEPESVPDAVVGPTVAVDVPVNRRGADRLARAGFKRGERWKARLPAAVHRKQV